jgi:hypothetical protein
VVLMADELARADLAPGGSALSMVINGGASQDVQQLHAHLLANQSLAGIDVSPAEPATRHGEVELWQAANRARETHLVLRPLAADGSLTDLAGVRAVVAVTQELVARLDLAPAGFSLIVAGSPRGLDLATVHLVSGRRVASGAVG